jgi:hypothetical protein
MPRLISPPIQTDLGRGKIEENHCDEELYQGIAIKFLNFIKES